MSDNIDSVDKVEDDFFDPSDEDFAKMSPTEYAALAEKDTEVTAETPEAEVEPAADEVDEEPADLEEEDDLEEENKEPVEPTEDNKEPVTDQKEESETPEVIDYEAKYKALMSSFKANGTQITPKSEEDARQLMQMGANYHKKMAGMKPALKALKTLENNGLLDEAQLNFLIDINKGNPEAIATLLKKQSINPLDLDTTTEVAYTPTNHSATDKELELDEVLDNIQTSPNYSRTLTAVTKEWDETSRIAAATDPHIISVINGHMDSGVYDTVMQAVQYDRSVGRLAGISDLEAYKLTGNRLESEGAFNSVTPKQKTEKELPSTPVDLAKEQKRKAQKKAASPTTNNSGKVSDLPPNFNPLDLSDEEFEKFDPKRLGIK